MKKPLVRRTLSLFLAIMLMISCMTVTAYAASGYNSESKVLRLHNSETVLNLSKLRSLFGFGILDKFQIKTDSETESVVEWNSTSDALKTFTALHGTKHIVEKGTSSGFPPTTTWQESARFTVEVYDNLKVTTNISEANVTVNDTKVTEEGTTVEVTRDDKATLVVNGLKDYSVTVKEGAKILASFETGQGGTVIISDLTEDKEVSVEYAKVNAASISLGENTDSATVQINGNGIVDGEQKTLNPGEAVTVTATPVDDNYIESLEVYNADEIVSEEMTFEGTTASVKFIPENDAEYTIKVTSKIAEIVLSNDTIGYNNKMTTDQIWESVYNLIDTEDSVPEITADNVSIKYKAYKASTIFGTDRWEDFDYQPNGLTKPGHAFGAENPETIQITYTPAEHYPLVSVEQEITLTENRTQPVITLKEDQTIEYYEGISKEDIYNLVFDSLKAEDGTDISEIAAFGEDGNMTVDVDLETLAPGQNTVTVNFEGNSEYLPAKAETTFNVEYVTKPASVVLSLNEGNAVITVNEMALSGDDTIYVNAGETVTVKATPADGNYIKDIEVFEWLDELESEVKWDGTTALVTFTANEDALYLINVYSEKAQISLKALEGSQETPTIGYNKTMNIDKVKESIFNLIDTDNSVPGMTAENVSIQYKAMSLGILGDSWQNLDYKPQTPLGHEFGENSTESVKITFDDPDDKYPAVSIEFTLALVDNRINTSVNLKANQSITYFEDITENDIYNLVFDSVTDVNGNEIEANFGENISITVGSGKINAGTYTVTVNYKGDETYAASSAQVEITVLKANVDVSVNSQIINYSEKDSINPLVSTNPDNVKCILFTAGLDVRDGSSYINLNLPELIDTKDIENEYIRNILNEIYESLKTDVSISELSKVLQTILNTLESLQSDYGLPINLDAETIQRLITTLESFEQLQGLSDLTVKITIGENIIPENIGAYIIGAVTSDANYVTNAAVGYLVITPDAAKVNLSFNTEIKNSNIARKGILSGEFDLGSHIVPDGLTEDQIAQATEKLTNVYVCLNKNGIYISNEPSGDVGAYVQISYIKDWDNQMYYAVPIVREYNVFIDKATVEFVDKDGNANSDQSFTYDGTPKAMTALVKDSNGNVLDSSKVTYKYIGLESDLNAYNSSEPPTESGVYTVIAEYAEYYGEDKLVCFGVSIGKLNIHTANSDFKINDTEFLFDGTGKTIDVINPNGLIYVEVIVDKNNNVNIILPESWGVAPGSINVEGGIQQLISKLNSLPEFISNSKLVAELEKLLNSITINTISINGDLPVEEGEYNITAFAFGKNYTFQTDTAVLSIVDKILIGDVDLDGNINVKDATLIQLYAAGLITLDEVSLSAADVNFDIKVDVNDTTFIQLYCAGLNTEGHHVGEYKEIRV